MLDLGDETYPTWHVYRFAFPFGATRQIGTVRAPTRARAEEIARERYGAEITVQLGSA